MQPGEVIEVGPAELLDLQRQGLLIPDPAEEQRAAAAPVKKKD